MCFVIIYRHDYARCMAQVTNDITKIINSVFHRNNNLKQLCEGILNGNVKYKSGLFNNTQRTK